MRFRHPDGSLLHVGYCSNVHPAEDADGVIAQLERVAVPTRRALEVPRLGVGLWLAAGAAAELRHDAARRRRLRAVLDDGGLEVVTLNGFPFGGFHDPVVKHAVYRPDWTDPARAAYTVDLAHVLVDLLPDDVVDGSISTLPIGWEGWVTAAGRATARDALRRVGDELLRLEERTGRRIRLGLEPEPGCVLPTAAAVCQEVRALDHPAVGIALDTCHLAVEFEDPDHVGELVGAGGGDAVKAQISNALDVPATEHVARRDELAAHVEPRFLHQTRARTADGEVRGVDDLDTALAGGLDDGDDWRVHFHVPVHAGPGTTQAVLARSLQTLVGGARPVVRHLEVETYTWSVLPEAQRPGSDRELANSLAAELAWVRERLLELDCTEVLT